MAIEHIASGTLPVFLFNVNCSDHPEIKALYQLFRTGHPDLQAKMASVLGGRLFDISTVFRSDPIEQVQFLCDLHDQGLSPWDVILIESDRLWMKRLGATDRLDVMPWLKRENTYPLRWTDGLQINLAYVMAGIPEWHRFTQFSPNPAFNSWLHELIETGSLYENFPLNALGDRAALANVPIFPGLPYLLGDSRKAVPSDMLGTFRQPSAPVPTPSLVARLASVVAPSVASPLAPVPGARPQQGNVPWRVVLSVVIACGIFGTALGGVLAFWVANQKRPAEPTQVQSAPVLPPPVPNNGPSEPLSSLGTKPLPTPIVVGKGDIFLDPKGPFLWDPFVFSPLQNRGVSSDPIKDLNKGTKYLGTEVVVSEVLKDGTSEVTEASPGQPVEYGVVYGRNNRGLIAWEERSDKVVSIHDIAARLDAVKTEWEAGHVTSMSRVLTSIRSSKDSWKLVHLETGNTKYFGRRAIIMVALFQTTGESGSPKYAMEVWLNVVVNGRYVLLANGKEVTLAGRVSPDGSLELGTRDKALPGEIIQPLLDVTALHPLQ